MLTLQERHEAVMFIRQFCTKKLLPADVDVDGWELRQRFKTPLRTKWNTKLFYAAFSVQGLYKIASLVLVMLSSNTTPLHQIIIHAVLAMAYGIFVYSYYVLYIQHGEVFTAFFQMTLTGKIGRGNATDQIGFGFP